MALTLFTQMGRRICGRLAGESAEQAGQVTINHLLQISILMGTICRRLTDAFWCIVALRSGYRSFPMLMRSAEQGSFGALPLAGRTCLIALACTVHCAASGFNVSEPTVDAWYIWV